MKHYSIALLAVLALSVPTMADTLWGLYWSKADVDAADFGFVVPTNVTIDEITINMFWGPRVDFCWSPQLIIDNPWNGARVCTKHSYYRSV